MRRAAEAVCHGAVTVVNAMATGRGAAVGVNMWTRARVTLTDCPDSIVVHNLTYPDVDTRLTKATVKRVFRQYGAELKFGAIVETTSNIPVAVGLKSSSAASNAIALDTVSALGRAASESSVVNMAVDASLKADVTLTGAFDDAMACFAGGLVITDNSRRRILKRSRLEERARVLIHIPRSRRYSKDVDRQRLRPITSVVEAAHREALRGNYWLALTLNGAAYARALDLDSQAADRALEAGAIAAGLSGKGPAVAAIVPTRCVDEVLSSWSSLPGRVIETSFNHRKARSRRLAT